LSINPVYDLSNPSDRLRLVSDQIHTKGRITALWTIQKHKGRHVALATEAEWQQNDPAAHTR